MWPGMIYVFEDREVRVDFLATADFNERFANDAPLTLPDEAIPILEYHQYAHFIKHSLIKVSNVYVDKEPLNLRRIVMESKEKGWAWVARLNFKDSPIHNWQKEGF